MQVAAVLSAGKSAGKSGDTFAGKSEDKNIQAAINCYKQAIHLEPDLAAAYQALAKLLFQQNQPTEAKAVIQTFASRRTQNNTIQNKITQNTTIQNNAIQNTTIQDNAIQDNAIQDTVAEVRQVAGSVARAGNSANSANSAVNASAEAQQRAIAFQKQGETLREQGQWEQAIAAYQKAIALHPRFSWAHHGLGDCCKKARALGRCGGGL